MERSEATDLMKKLVDLFPSTNEVQAREWRDVFIAHPKDVIEKAITVYYRTDHRGFTDGLMNCVRAVHREKSAQEDEQRAVQRRIESAFIASNREVDQTIAGLPDDVLAPLFKQVMDEMQAEVTAGRMEPWVVAQRQKHGPRMNRYVKGRIYAIIDGPVKA